LNTPNKITVARIVATPFLAWLIYQDGPWDRVFAFVAFVAVAVSDLVDGRLARDREEVTRFGQLLDPIADKLLVLVTFIPLYGIGLLPMWLVVLVLAREVVITVFRRYALRRGRLIAASRWGKSKALVQNWYIGSLLVLRINQALVPATGGAGWARWTGYTRAEIQVALWFVAGLTVVSLVDYLVRHRRLWGAATA